MLTLCLEVQLTTPKLPTPPAIMKKAAVPPRINVEGHKSESVLVKPTYSVVKVAVTFTGVVSSTNARVSNNTVRI